MLRRLWCRWFGHNWDMVRREEDYTVDLCQKCGHRVRMATFKGITKGLKKAYSKDKIDDYINRTHNMWKEL